MKVSFETTIDDSVELAYRLLKREEKTPQIFNYLFRAAFLASVASLPCFMFIPQIWIGCLSFVLVFVAIWYLYPFPTENFYRKYYRSFYGKMYENNSRIICEVEVIEKGLRTCWSGNEYILAWENIAEIQNAEEEIYFFDTIGSGTRVKKSAFGSAEQFARFIALASSYKESVHQLSND